MAVYHQMGHDSRNLLFEPALAGYAGAILSPVNEIQSQITAQIQSVSDRTNFETIFDPQLYFPNTLRGCLREWSYFPSDVDTADLSSDAWWSALIEKVASTASEIGCSAVCSPAIVPRVYNDDFFATLVEKGNQLCTALNSTSVRPIQTAIVSLADLSVPRRSLAVASILSSTRCDKVYLVFVSNTDPRRELADPEELKGGMKLISALEGAGVKVLVGFCSSDIILWKTSGASSCATGKFFNLRRFTSSRFEEPSGGAGQLPYWFEESLVAFLRESDVLRIQPQNLLSPASLANPFCQSILAQFRDNPGSPWIRLWWRQFMYWFMDVEKRIRSGELDVRTLLREAEINWRTLENADVLMEEQRNDGSWLRAWRRAVAEYASH